MKPVLGIKGDGTAFGHLVETGVADRRGTALRSAKTRSADSAWQTDPWIRDLKAVVIVPTYNEAENIGPLVRALQQQFAGLNHDMAILVVDDGSPDGTADVVRNLQREFANLHMIEGRKAGLGAAYVRDMRSALDADVVSEMDADFSHKPEDVLRPMAETEAGADFVIGSREVKGGTIPSNWGLHRRLTSWMGNLAARYIAGIYRVRACIAGSRTIRYDLLRTIDFDSFGVQGYAFQVALLHAAMIRGARIKEILVDFIDLERGASKLGPSDIFEFLVNVWWIRLENSKTFIKFALVGASGIMVNLGTLTLLLGLGINRYLASPMAIEMSIISNFLLNNAWPFRWRNLAGGLCLRGMKFNLVSLPALAISYGVFVTLSLLFPAAPPQLHRLSASFQQCS